MDRTATRDLSETCLTDWVMEHANSLRGYLSSLTHDAAVAEDLLQETFLRSLATSGGLRRTGKGTGVLIPDCGSAGDRPSPSSIGSEGDSPLSDDREDAQSEQPIEGLLRQERRAQLEAAMRNLTPIQQRVLLLRYFGELSFEEIALVVGCPLGTALSHGHRGLEQLRKILVKNDR